MAEDEFKTFNVNSNRSSRFFKHVINNTKNMANLQAGKKRSEFVTKIDKLRNVDQVKQIHGIEKIEAMPNRKNDEIERKISSVLDYEQRLEDEERFSRQILSRLSSNEDQKMTLLKQIANKEGLDVGRIKNIEKKLSVIEELKQKIRSMQSIVARLMEEEKKNKSYDTKIFEIEELLKKDKTELQEDTIKIQALRNKLNFVLKELEKRESGVKKVGADDWSGEARMADSERVGESSSDSYRSVEGSGDTSSREIPNWDDNALEIKKMLTKQNKAVKRKVSLGNSKPVRSMKRSQKKTSKKKSNSSKKKTSVKSKKRRK